MRKDFMGKLCLGIFYFLALFFRFFLAWLWDPRFLFALGPTSTASSAQEQSAIVDIYH